MSNKYAKAAIMSVFLNQLNDKPFDKISVVDIARQAGVSRNTFYYWYSDIYALVDDLFHSETQKIRQESRSFDSWLDGFLHAMQFVGENRRAVYHLYNSISRNKLEAFLYDVTLSDMTRVVEAQARDTGASTEDIHDIAAFYSAALLGLAIRWLDTGMKEDPEAYLENMGELLGDNLHVSLVRSGEKAD
jgi:AcrR family transcriptional regulator